MSPGFQIHVRLGFGWVLQGEGGQPALGSVPVQPHLTTDEECLLAQAGVSPGPKLLSLPLSLTTSQHYPLTTLSWLAPGSPVRSAVQLGVGSSPLRQAPSKEVVNPRI